MSKTLADLELQKRELLFEVQRCAELFNTQVFINRQIFTQSAFIELLVRLNHVLQALSNAKKRIDWTDDVQTNTNIKDITDLVKGLRNAACHIDSPQNYVSDTSIKFVFNTFVGKCPNAFKLGVNIMLGSDYADDFAFYYGDKRIYLFRHIKKLIEELPLEINSAH